jgi:ubiquitin C-terminal hydrolase
MEKCSLSIAIDLYILQFEFLIKMVIQMVLMAPKTTNIGTKASIKLVIYYKDHKNCIYICIGLPNKGNICFFNGPLFKKLDFLML